MFVYDTALVYIKKKVNGNKYNICLYITLTAVTQSFNDYLTLGYFL